MAKPLIALLLLLSGCATGIEMTKEEAEVCKARGCSVWTETELLKLARKFYNEGYKDGYKSI
jgi:hypothetical protein